MMDVMASRGPRPEKASPKLMLIKYWACSMKPSAITHSATFVATELVAQPHMRVSNKSAGCETIAAAAPANNPARTIAYGRSLSPEDSGDMASSSCCADRVTTLTTTS
eukprot:CAMPEP_0205889876 /NCGR_PEP_ID=MMETSP1083-20121108/21212_1 /ASSEMBLY_ACC=CAM_ASM_000430 /TAXON_ID=97485 /ORGANISM="Prymnesium parvum, Strain Texoma1" /LENGTH=107 /DNA_ID=CAMNT_0053254027 /DNA_START=417 /DNA_END=740 /DNA_ORIENTATION=+